MAVADPRREEPAAPITRGMISSLRSAHPWALFLALYGFLCAALAGVAAIIGWAQPDGRLFGAAQWVLAMVYLMGAFPLFRFARALRRIGQEAGAAPLEEALAHQHTFLRILGIALLLDIALVSLAISVSFVRELTRPDDDAPPPRYASIAQACDAQAEELLCGTVAFFDPQGKLVSWTGWHTFVPEKPRTLNLSLYSFNRDNGVQLSFRGPGNSDWIIQASAPWGRILAPGEYTGARFHSSEVQETGILGLRTPPAWFPVEAGSSGKVPDWPGTCAGLAKRATMVAGRQSRFTVREIQWARDGEPRKLSMDFEQSCTIRQGTWLVLGRVRGTRHD